MRKQRALLATWCSALIALSSTDAHSGAWTQEARHGLLAISGTYYSGAHFFDNNGNRRPQQRYQKHEISAYGEWGLQEGLSVGANIFASRAEQSGEENYSLSNSEFFLRRRIYRDDTRVISLQPLIKLPSYAYHGSGPQSGSESTDAELALLYGQSTRFFSERDFLDLAFAVRTRSDGLSPQWRTESKYGIGLTERWMFIAALYITQSTELDTPSSFREGGDLDYHLSKAEVSAIYDESDRHYWQISGFNHIAGAQAGAGYGISLTRGMRF